MDEDTDHQKQSGRSNIQPLGDTLSRPTIEERIATLEAQSHSRENAIPTATLVEDVRRGEWWLIGINGLLLLATVGIACIYIGQLREMQKSTRATEVAANAACLGAKVSRSTLIELQSGAQDAHNATQAALYQAMASTQGENAIIYPKLAHYVVTEKNQIALPYVMENSGKTAAKNIHTELRLEMVSRATEPKFIFAASGPTKTITPGLLAGRVAPNGAFIWSVPLTTDDGKHVEIRQQDVQDLEEGRKDLLLYGRIEYNDLFGLHHRRRICIPVQQHLPAGDLDKSPHTSCIDYNRDSQSSLFPKTNSSKAAQNIISDFDCPVIEPQKPKTHWWSYWLF